MKIYALIILVSCLSLSACSKKAEDRAADASIEHSTEQAADAPSQTLEPNTTPQTEEKPTQILNSSVNPAEQGRRMVRQASVSFSAQDVVKTSLAIDKLTLEMGGFVEQKDINFRVIDEKRLKTTDAKIKVFEKVDPYAELILRIPSDQAANFVNRLLPFMHFLNEQQYSAKRQELKLLEEKMNQTQIIPENTKNAQLSEIARLTQLEVQDRIRYSTIVVRIDQPTTVRERSDIDLAAVAQINGDGFWKRAWNAVQEGWQFILDFIIVLITIWPFYLILIIGLLLYRLIKPIINKIIK